MMDWYKAMREKAQGSTDAAFWNTAADEIETLRQRIEAEIPAATIIKQMRKIAELEKELASIKQEKTKDDDFMSQLAEHTQVVEAELIKWQNGEIRIKSKSPYLSGELDGNTYPGIGHIAAAPKPEQEAA